MDAAQFKKTVNGAPVTLTTTSPAEAVSLRAQGWQEVKKAAPKSAPKTDQKKS